MNSIRAYEPLPPLRQKVDQYSYLSKQSIGKGYSSNVYKGRDDKTDRQVAIKIIDMKKMKGDISRQLLMAEIEVLNMIKNRPYLLDVHKICSENSKTYIITDYCEGGDLGKYIKAKKKLSEQQAVRIIQQIIKGYQNLYVLGVVHRDLKPANIFFHNSLTEIGDFGFASKQENLKASSKYNVGSPVYMPPEALTNNRYSHKSDIWAIGIIFYEMLTGNPPWSGKTENQLKVKVKTIPIETILPPSLSTSSNLFLKRSLQVDPRKRMEPKQMFDHFELNHTCVQVPVKEYSSEKHHNLFRSMRKPSRNSYENQADSLKKTTSRMARKFKHQLHQTNYPNPEVPKLTHDSLTPVQKRLISKQLLSQVHFCRFLYKLIMHVDVGASYQMNPNIREQLVRLLFYKLAETRSLKLVSQDLIDQYRQFSDYRKLQTLIKDYFMKYMRKLKFHNESHLPSFYSKEMYDDLIKNLKSEIVTMYTWLENAKDTNAYIKEIIVLDYLITVNQLIGIASMQSLSEFHVKSKIQIIVDGEPLEQVSNEHVRLIGNKLKALRIL